MQTNLRAKVAAALSTLSLTACVSLITPHVETGAVALKPGEYALDPDHAALLFRVEHMGFSYFIGRFEHFEASLDFDEADPTAARVEAIIDMTSLDVANDEFAATLTGPNWFNASAYRQAVFRSTSIETTGENTGRVTGELTVHGVTAPVALNVVFNGGGRDILRGAYVVGFSAHGTFDRATFGVDRFSGVVGDQVEIEIEAEFLRK
ncbi:MAG: YceI family protein [Parvularculaceae bacterium]